MLDEVPQVGLAYALARAFQLLLGVVRKFGERSHEVAVWHDAALSVRRREAVGGGLGKDIACVIEFDGVLREFGGRQRGIGTRGEILETVGERLELGLHLLKRLCVAVHRKRLARQKRRELHVKALLRGRVVASVLRRFGKLHGERGDLRLAAVTLQRQVHNRIKRLVRNPGTVGKVVKLLGKLRLRVDSGAYRRRSIIVLPFEDASLVGDESRGDLASGKGGDRHHRPPRLLGRCRDGIAFRLAHSRHLRKLLDRRLVNGLG